MGSALVHTPGTGRVLVVDDTEAQRNTIASAMRAEGFEVHEAATGHEALEVAQRVAPDVVLLDVHLPDLDGFEVCRRLKSNSANFLPVLHLSSTHIGETAFARGRDAGGDGYLTHPFNPADLRVWVGTLIRMKREIDHRVADASLNALLRHSLDALGDHVALLGPTGELVAVNRAWTAFAEANGSSHGTGVGANYCDVCDGAEGDHADGARAVAEGIRRVLAGETLEYEQDYPCHSPTEERWFRMTARRIAEPGSVAAIVVHVNQTRARLAARAEEEARAETERAYLAHYETEARFRRFVETANEGVVATDVEGRITYANARAGELMACGHAELVGRLLFDLMSAASATEVRARFANLRSGESVMAEAELHDNTGRCVEVLASLSPILNAGGTLAGVLALIADQRNQKFAEREMATALRAAELDRRRLQATLEALPAGVWIAESDGRVTHTNPAADRIWGGSAPRTAQEAQSVAFRASWPQSGLPIQPGEWPLVRTLETGETLNGILVEVERADGTRGWVLNSSAPILDDSGRTIGGVVAQLDVTEREQAARERETLLATLGSEREHLTEIFDNAPAFLAVLRGPDFVFERFNLRFQELVGHRAVMGVPAQEVMPELAPRGSLERMRGVRETGKALVMKGTPLSYVPRPGAAPVERFVDVVYQRLTALDGNHAVVVHGIDVTEQVESAEKLLLSKERLRDQFAKLPVPTFLWEERAEDFVLIECNEAAIVQDPRLRSAAGSSARALYPADDEVRDDMRRCLRENRVVRRHSERRDAANGALRHFDLTIGPQQPDRVLLHAVDTTEQLALETRLRQSQKMEAVGQLAAGIAHDFNNVLGVIMSYTGVLLEELPPESSISADLREVQSAIDRAAGLTGQLLAFGRQQPRRVELVELREALASTDRLLRRLIGEEITVSLALDGKDRFPVRVDVSQLEQVVMNLAVNARDAMPRGGDFSLTMEGTTISASEAHTRGVEAGPYVRLSVADSGIGMDEHVMSHMFDPFFTTKEVGKGTGLGLATVYGIVVQSGGFISVESTPGSGSVFHVFFPIAEADDAPNAADVQALPDVADARQHTILLVEDEDALRLVTERVLRRYGYDVVPAANPREALALMQDDGMHIDCMVSDVVMPGMSGQELASLIRAERGTMPVLLLSGYARDVVEERGVVALDIPLLRKPVKPSELRDAIAVLLAPRGIARAS